MAVRRSGSFIADQGNDYESGLLGALCCVEYHSLRMYSTIFFGFFYLLPPKFTRNNARMQFLYAVFLLFTLYLALSITIEAFRIIGKAP